ncbi:MAG: hypothetical protein ACPL7B_03740, partial [Candidatus Poribacteria bacterium]
RNMIIKAIIALVVIGLLIFIIRMIFKVGRESRVTELDMGPTQPLMLEQPTTEKETTPELTAAEKEEIPQLAMSTVQKQKQEILDIIEKDPEMVVQLLRDVMSK